MFTEEQKEFIFKEYERDPSTTRIAKILNCSYATITRLLKKQGKLLSTSELAKRRVGNKNPFFGKTHTNELKEKLSEYSKQRTGERNPNYRHGNYKRRTKDFLIVETQELRKLCFERDDYTCQVTGIRGKGVLHAHHLIPYWVCPEAYLDLDNLITVRDTIHKSYCHKNDYAKFNPDIVPESLLKKYNICRERLNELANFKNKKLDAIVRTPDINETGELDRND